MVQNGLLLTWTVVEDGNQKPLYASQLEPNTSSRVQICRALPSFALFVMFALFPSLPTTSHGCNSNANLRHILRQLGCPRCCPHRLYRCLFAHAYERHIP